MTFESFLAAVDEGDHDVVQTAISQQPTFCDRRDESGIRALMRACYNRHFELADLLADASEPLDLFEAAAIGETERISEMLPQPSVNVDGISRDGFPPLALASFFGRHEVVSLLLAEGADPNLEAENVSGVRPIHSAVANRADDSCLITTRLLLEGGADPNVSQAGGYTPLHTAAAHGRVALVELLLEFNADPELACDDGRTPCNMARENGHIEVAELLER